MAEIPSLNAKLPDNLKTSIYRPIMEYLEIPLVIRKVKTVKDREGDKVTFAVTLDNDPVEFYLATRANQPFRVGRWMIETAALPIRAKFTMKGKAIFLVDPSEVTETPGGDEIPF